MWSEIRRNPRALFYALLIHVALLVLVTFGLDWDSQLQSVPRAPVVEAVAVDQSLVDQELQKIRDLEAERERKKDEAIKTREREEQRLAEVKQQQAAEQQRLAELEQQRAAEAAATKRRQEAEKKRQAEVKQQQAAEQRRLAELEQQRAAEAAETKRRQEAEKKRQAEVKQQQAAEQKRLAELEQQKQAAEKKRRDEEARLAALEAQRKVDEQKRQAAAEAERQRRAEETAQRQREIAAETERQAAEADRVAQSTAVRYTALIRDRVERSWLRSPGLPDKLEALLLVRLDPFGEVLEARIVRSSGNALFDRSAEAAVKKASPLPVPSDVTIYNRFFREFQFVFKPEG
jgi:colicin import membrane protein